MASSNDEIMALWPDDDVPANAVPQGRTNPWGLQNAANLQFQFRKATQDDWNLKTLTPAGLASFGNWFVSRKEKDTKEGRAWTDRGFLTLEEKKEK